MRQILAELTRPIAPAPIQPRPESWSDNKITVCWLGHATVLINFYGLTILTDPVFSDRVGVSLGLGTAGPKRFIAPALRFDQLPPIDLVLLSHAHMDHMDRPSLRKFPKSTLAVTAPETRDLIGGKAFKETVEMRWGERLVHHTARGEIEIEAFEVRHWGRRWPKETLNRGYNGYLLRRGSKAILFGGDTAYTPLFRALRSKGPFEMGIMPIAAYDPWIRSHCTPEEALKMVNDAGAGYIVPVHHQTFRLSEEPLQEPMERLREALLPEPERLALRQVGESFSVS
jgi:L-ascorbate metabolism protein UlaG (beta-lactamase superfamily)